MALDTRVRCVIATHNMGYSIFYVTLLQRIGCIQDNNLNSRLLSTGISRLSETRKQNKTRKALPSTKRKRRHGRFAKTKQQVYEERIDRAQKMGTYQTGIAVEGENIQQSTTKQP